MRASPLIRSLKAVFIGLACTGIGALVLWPYVAPTGDRLQIAATLPIVTLGSDREAVLNAVYTGIDRQGRPFALHAAVIRPVESDRNKVRLVTPRLSMTLADGRPATIQANLGTYDQDTWLLALAGNVMLDLATQYQMKTESTVLDIREQRAEGNKAVMASGPFGHLQADGFLLEEGGNRLTFLGRSRMITRETFDAGPS